VPQLPHRLSSETPYDQTISLINDSFDKSVQDMADLGAKFSSVASGSFTLGTNSMNSLVVGLSDPSKTYVSGSTQIVPRIDIFIDNNNDEAWRFARGASAAPIPILCTPGRIARTPASGDIAEYEFQFYNLDVSSHVIYYSVDSSFIQSASRGIFR
jgi:hypothetical protein